MARAVTYIKTFQRRYRELVEGKVKGVPGPLVLKRLRARLSVSNTEEQRAELDRRLAEYEKNPDAGSPWLEVKARILKGRRVL